MDHRPTCCLSGTVVLSPVETMAVSGDLHAGGEEAALQHSWTFWFFKPRSRYAVPSVKVIFALVLEEQIPTLVGTKRS